MINNNNKLWFIFGGALLVSGCTSNAPIRQELLNKQVASLTHNPEEIRLLTIDGENAVEERVAVLKPIAHKELKPGLHKVTAQLNWSNYSYVMGTSIVIKSTSPEIKQACFMAQAGDYLVVGAELLPTGKLFNSLRAMPWNIRISDGHSPVSLSTPQKAIPLIPCP
ncbi:hypothetical protein [Thiolinea disciformis]|uniref:hypothetical protein n=1 Tax=Thiolinea disciformis TaxID=125614 RepID=UPI000365835A|nr:hypothetical protein [Thiolinea disciformis]